MRGEQAIFNLEIKKKSVLSINPDFHHSKVFSSGHSKYSTAISVSDTVSYIYISNFSKFVCCFLHAGHVINHK